MQTGFLSPLAPRIRPRSRPVGDVVVDALDGQMLAGFTRVTSPMLDFSSTLGQSVAPGFRIRVGGVGDLK